MAEFTKDEKEEILSQAIQFWNKATLAQENFFDLVNEMERLARGLLPEDLESVYDGFNDRSALVPPDIYNNLASNRAFIRNALFKRKPFFHLSIRGMPGFRDDRIEKAEEVVQGIMDSHDEGKGYQTVADKFIDQALSAGFTATYIQWTKDLEREVVKNEFGQPTIDKNGRPVFRDVVVAEYPEVKPTDIRRVRIDPSATDRKDIRLVGYQHLMTLSEALKKNKSDTPGNDHWSFDEQELRNSPLQHDKYFEYVKSESDMYPDKGERNTSFSDEQIEVWSIRGLFRFPDSTGSYTVRDLIVEVGNRTILMAVKHNDLPLRGWELFDFPAIDEKHGRLYTMGLIEPARDGFIEQFVKRNQSLDSANRNVYNTYIGDSAACENLSPYIEGATDQIILVDTMAAGLPNAQSALSVLQRPQLGQDTFAHSKDLERSTQITMKLSDFTAGATPQNQETATGVSALVSSGRSLTEHVIEKLTDTAFRPHIRKMMILWNFFKGDQDQEIFSRKSPVPLLIEAGELNLPFLASVDTNIALTEPSMVRRFIEALPLMLQDPFVNGRVLRETMVEILDLPNKDTLLVDDDHLQAIIQRENVSLLEGIPLNVHPQDKHQQHFEGHSQAAEVAGGSTPEMDEHIKGHAQIIQQQQQALGNTKELGGGTGNLTQPDAAASRPSTGGATGRFTASENRR